MCPIPQYFLFLPILTVRTKSLLRNVFRVICYDFAGPNSLASVLLFVSLMVFNATFSLAQYLFSTGYARLVDFHTVKLHVQTNNRNFFYLFFEKYITRKSHKFSNSKNTYIIVIHNVPQNTSNCH